jgi:hypothetical protein
MSRHSPVNRYGSEAAASRRRRHVEPDDLEGGIELIDERLQQLEAGADAVQLQARIQPQRPDGRDYDPATER